MSDLTEEWTAGAVDQPGDADRQEDEQAAEAEPVGGDGERGQPCRAAEQAAEESAGTPRDAGDDEQSDAVAGTPEDGGGGGRGG
jgi:hypothetical protein